jgi:hypothetical protein
MDEEFVSIYNNLVNIFNSIVDDANVDGLIEEMDLDGALKTKITHASQGGQSHTNNPFVALVPISE